MTERAPMGTDPRISLETGRFWAGAVATAVVAALIGVVGVVVFENALGINLYSMPNFFPSSDLANYAAASAILALLAALLAYLLVLATPRPRIFFGWIMALVIVTAVVLPFTWTNHLDVALCTSGLNLVIGIAIWLLTAQVTRRTMTVPRHADPPSPPNQGGPTTPYPPTGPTTPYPPAGP